MPCIVILNSIHQDNFYGFLKLPVSPPFSAHPWPNTAIVPITCRKRPRIMKYPPTAGPSGPEGAATPAESHFR